MRGVDPACRRLHRRATAVARDFFPHGRARSSMPGDRCPRLVPGPVARVFLPFVQRSRLTRGVARPACRRPVMRWAARHCAWSQDRDRLSRRRRPGPGSRGQCIDRKVRREVCPDSAASRHRHAGPADRSAPWDPGNLPLGGTVRLSAGGTTTGAGGGSVLGPEPAHQPRLAPRPRPPSATLAVHVSSREPPEPRRRQVRPAAARRGSQDLPP